MEYWVKDEETGFMEDFSLKHIIPALMVS